MKLLILNGPSCAGKTSVIKGVMEREERLFRLSYDLLKWMISDYSPKRDYRGVQDIVLAVAKEAMKSKYDIIADSFLYKSHRGKIISLAEEFGYKVQEVNLTADLDVLEKRFEKRVAEALNNPERKVSNLSKERFHELYDIFEKEKNKEAETIRTDTNSLETVTSQIVSLLEK